MGRNAAKFKDEFETEVRMWVYEEMVNGEKLTEVINTQHENVKYLPGKKLPSNVVRSFYLIVCKHKISTALPPAYVASMIPVFP